MLSNPRPAGLLCSSLSEPATPPVTCRGGQEMLRIQEGFTSTQITHQRLCSVTKMQLNASPHPK